MGWIITKDNIAYEGEPNRVGMRVREQSVIHAMQLLIGEPIQDLPATGNYIAFRLRDEDNEVHYEGVMDDDDECLNQSDASEFGAADTGGFICEVWRDGAWKMEVS